jgi:hypothetical protein
LRPIRLSTPREKRPKYGNKKTLIDGIEFDSKREAEYYSTLKIMQRSGLVKEIRHHVSFDLHVNGFLICRYEADFTYLEKIWGSTGVWQPIVVDVKGVKTRTYSIKKKLMRAIHGIEIKEV